MERAEISASFKQQTDAKAVAHEARVAEVVASMEKEREELRAEMQRKIDAVGDDSGALVQQL